MQSQTFSWWLLFSCMWQHADMQNSTSVPEIPSTCKGQKTKAAGSSSSSSFSSSIWSHWGPRRQCAQAMTTFLILHQFIWHFVTAVNKNNKILNYKLPAVHNNLCQVTQLCKMKTLRVQQRCLHALLSTTWLMYRREVKVYLHTFLTLALGRHFLTTGDTLLRWLKTRWSTT